MFLSLPYKNKSLCGINNDKRMIIKKRFLMIKILHYNVNANDNEEGRCMGVQCAKRTKF